MGWCSTPNFQSILTKKLMKKDMIKISTTESSSQLIYLHTMNEKKNEIVEKKIYENEKK